MNWLAFLAMTLQLATALWALHLLGKTREKTLWVFFCLAALAMLGWRIARWWELEFAPGTMPASHAWVDAIMGLSVTVLFFFGVLTAGGAMTRLVREHERLAQARELTALERDKLQRLLERLPVGVVVEQEQGIVYANSAFLRMLEVDERRVQQQKVLDFVAPEQRASLTDTGHNSSDGARVMEVELVRPDGSRFWVSGRRHHAVWMEKPAQVWVFSDISEQKAAEAQKDAIFKLFSQGPVVLIRWRPAPERNVAFVTENIRAWGFEPQQLMADHRSFYEIVHPEDRAKAQEEARRFFASGAESWSQEYRILCPDGKVRWILDRTVVLRNGQGRVVGFDGYLLDISELQETRHALEEERLRYAAALEATGEVVYDWNVATGDITWNRAVLKAFGYTQEQMGGIAEWAERIHPEDRERVTQLLDQSLATGQPFEAEYRFGRANGTYAHVFDRGVVERDQAGKPVRMVGAMADLTALKKLEEQLRLSQRLEALGQLAGGVAHDFNNLLTAIMGTLDLMERKLDPGDSLFQDVASLRKSAQRAATLTRQLLAFARRQVIELHPLDLNKHLEASLDMFRRLLPENVRLDFIPGRQLGTIMADPGQLDQILVNLLVNARDAMPQGGVITIETENVLVNGDYVRQHPWAKHGRYVLLSVSDTGVGMDEAIRERIFEPFFTTKEPGKGTGLGLSTVYGIVKQHDGMIHVYSEVGKGTTFKIYFPLVERRAVEVGTKVEGPVVGGNERILLVEDEEAVRQVLAESLAALGYQVFTATDGEDALRQLEEKDFAVDLVVSDVVMPRMGGWELYQAVQERAPHVVFLFSTGYSENAVHVDFKKKEGVFLITKPYGLDSLARKVREILDKKKSGEI